MTLPRKKCQAVLTSKTGKGSLCPELHTLEGLSFNTHTMYIFGKGDMVPLLLGIWYSGYLLSVAR